MKVDTDIAEDFDIEAGTRNTQQILYHWQQNESIDI